MLLENNRTKYFLLSWTSSDQVKETTLEHLHDQVCLSSNYWPVSDYEKLYIVINEDATLNKVNEMCIGHFGKMTLPSQMLIKTEKIQTSFFTQENKPIVIYTDFIVVYRT